MLITRLKWRCFVFMLAAMAAYALFLNTLLQFAYASDEETHADHNDMLNSVRNRLLSGGYAETVLGNKSGIRQNEFATKTTAPSN